MHASLLSLCVSAISVAAHSIKSTDTQWKFPKLIDAQLEDLGRGLSKGCFNSSELVKVYLERIRQSKGQLNAVTEVNPDAFAIAESLDEERRAGKSRALARPGSTLLLGAKVPHDSTVAKKLRDAGAILLGKTNMNEWADYRSSWLPAGFSPHGNQTYGAYYAHMSPGGSSSGSGISVDVGLAWAVLGTETSGSIHFPR